MTRARTARSLRAPLVAVAAAVTLCSALLPSARTAGASEARIFKLDTRAAALAGEVDQVAIDPRGSLSLARDLERLVGVEEPFVFSADAAPDGWILGTGSSGRVVLVERDGAADTAASQTIAVLEAPSVFAVLGAPHGLYAAASPDGAVHRLDPDGDRLDPDGSSSDAGGEPLFDPEATYVWDLATRGDDDVLVATGLPGQVWRVSSRGGAAELLHESSDPHVRALVALDGGAIVVGTAGQGLVQRIRGDEVETLYDAAQPEIAAFAVGPAGEIYAAAVSSEASLVDLSTQQQATQTEGTTGEATVVTANDATTTTVGSRGSGTQGPRSLVVRIDPDGTVDEVASFTDETVHSLAWHAGALWIGTGQEGRLERWTSRPAAGEPIDGRARAEGTTREASLDDRQIVALVPDADGSGLAAVTTNGAAVYGLDDGPASEGTYTSTTLDAEQIARFGALRWRGALPAGAAVELSARSGTSATPDGTWTPWVELTERRVDDRGARDDGSARGDRAAVEASLEALPNGRYIQWRARLVRGDGRGAAGSSPRIDEVELSYGQLNLRPSITSLEVLAPGQILVPQSYNPTSTTFEPFSPNRDGIFDTLRAERADDGRLKTLYKRGWRTLRWASADPNGDPLRSTLEVSAEASPGGDDDGSTWLPVVESLDQDWYSFDSTVLPDGVYRFRLRVADGEAHPAGEGLAAAELSEPVTVDHTPPRIAATRTEQGALVVELVDERSPIRRVEVSVDAGAWRSVPAVDGLLDGRRERVRVEVPEGATLVLLRALDASFNVLTSSVQ